MKISRLFLYTFCCTAQLASGASVFWDNGGGDNNWMTANNWSPNGLPESTDDVYFENSSHRTAFLASGSDTVNLMLFGGTAHTYTFTLGSTGEADLTATSDCYIGYNVSGADATFKINNGSGLVANTIIMGASNSTGKLEINDGFARVNSFATLGSGSSGTGYLELNGNDTSMLVPTNLNVGWYGTGDATVDGGLLGVGEDLRVGYQSGSFGEIEFSNNAVAQITDDLIVYAGEGSINQLSGSQVTVTDQVYLGQLSSGVGVWDLDDSSADIGDDLFVGFDGSGAVTLDGGATMDIADYLVVARNSGSGGGVYILDGALSAANANIGGNSTGDGGTGIVQIFDGSLSISNATTIRGPGTVILDGGTFETGSLSSVASGGSVVHRSGTLHLNGGNWDYENTENWTLESSDGSGTATVEYTGSTVDHSSYDLYLADTKSGELKLNDGASFHTTNVYVASGEGGDGTLTIGGDPANGTPYLSALNLTIGDAESNNSSTGTLDFNGDSTHGYITLGDADFSSLADSTASAIYISDSGPDGNLTLQGGADLNGLTSSATKSTGLYVGYFAGDGGSVDLGSGSNFTNNGTVYIGYAGNGSMALNGSASIDVTGNGNDLYLGYALGSRGELSGANGSVSDNLYVGESGDGWVEMSSGDSFEADDIYIARLSGSSGTLDVSASSLTVVGDVFAGTGGAATVLISDDGSFDIGGNLEIGSGDSFIIDQATLTVGGSIEGDLSITDPVSGGSALTIGGTAPGTTVNGGISGTGSITKTGSNTVTFSGTNSYTGATTINEGILAISEGATSALANTEVTISPGAGLEILDTVGGQTYALGSLVGSGSIDLGAATLDLGGNGGDTIFEGVISGSGSITKSGSNTITLSGSNTYTGTTTITAGTLEIAAGNSDALANSAVTVGSGSNLKFADAENGYEYTAGSLAGAGDLDTNGGYLYVGGDNSSTTFSGNLTDTASFQGAIFKQGAGTWSLGGSNNDVFQLYIYEGAVVLDGASGSFGLIHDAGADLTIQNVDSGLVIDRLENVSSGTLHVTGSSTSFVGDEVKNEGAMTVDDGAQVAITKFSQVTNGATITVDQSSLSVDHFNTLKGTIAISDAADGSPALTLGSDTYDSTLLAAIEDHTSGPGSVLKTGSKTITLAGANTYTGTTTITAGTLEIAAGNSDALANSAVTVGSGSNLKFADAENGYEYTAGSLAGAGDLDTNGGSLYVGGDNTSTTFSGNLTDTASFQGAIFKQGAGTWSLSGSNNDVFQLYIYEGAVVLDGASGSFGLIYYAGTDLTIQNVDSGLVINRLENVSSGTLHITGSSTSFVGNGVKNEGVMTVDDGAQVAITQFTQVTNGATITVDQSSLSLDYFSTLKGTIAISDAADGSPALTLGGDNYDSTLLAAIEDHTSGSGSVTKTGSNTLILASTNSYTGATTIEAGTLKTDNLAGDLIHTAGTFSPGFSPAATTIGGDYTMTSDSILVMELGGTTPGTEYDTLTVSGTVTLAGTLQIDLIDDHLPALGDSYQLIINDSANPINGTFAGLAEGATFVPDGLSAGFQATITYQGGDGNDVVLSIGVGDIDTMDAFRNVYGLDPDGADDALDWSENGIANILYFAFGLGDPNLTDVDYTRLPQLETSDSTDTIVFSYVHPSGSNHGIIATVATSEDLADWFTPAELGSGYLPVSEETEDLGEGYERISETYGMNGESRRFYRLSVRSAR